MTTTVRSSMSLDAKDVLINIPEMTTQTFISRSTGINANLLSRLTGFFLFLIITYTVNVTSDRTVTAAIKKSIDIDFK